MAAGAARRSQGGTADAGDLRVVLGTAPPGAARRLARVLVEGRFAACVSLLPGLVSVYRWRGAVETARETLLVVKTTARRLPACLAALADAHPYEVPEALALAPDRALAAYAAWVRAEASPARRP
jgi:periplasmic divalent cation tolerance protein